MDISNILLIYIFYISSGNHGDISNIVEVFLPPDPTSTVSTTNVIVTGNLTLVFISQIKSLKKEHFNRFI